MKKLFYLFALMCTFTIVSCQQDEIETPITNTSENVKSSFELVQITPEGDIIPLDEALTRSEIRGEVALSFESEAAYNKALADMEKLNRDDRLELTNSLGFISLQQICDIADEELEYIDSISVGVEDFLERYNAYVKKYEGQLVRNPYDSTDMSLYIPDDSEMTTYLINGNRNVVIGKVIMRSPIINVNDSQYIVTSGYSDGYKSYSWQSIYNNSKKTSVNIKILTTGDVRLQAGCQKKVTLGWKRDNNRWVYVYLTNGSFPINLWYNKSLDPTCYLASQGKLYEMSIGSVNGIGVTGELYVWTDQTIDPDLQPQWVKVYSQPDNDTFYAFYPYLLFSNALGGAYSIHL